MNIKPHDIDRHVDLALRREPDAGPPADFARNVAELARVRAADPAVERWLVRVLMVVLVLAGLVVAAIYGHDWMAAFGALPVLGGATAMNWALRSEEHKSELQSIMRLLYAAF